jgi:hypothetical protein
MQQHTETATSGTATVERIVPRVYQMGAGVMFMTQDQPDRILALLTHAQVDVRDTTHIWCVVIAAGRNCALPAGSLVPLPRATEVIRLHVERPMQLVAVH